MGISALIMLAFRITLATLVLVCAYLAHAQLKSTTGDDLLCITGRFNNQYPCGLTDPTDTIPSEVTGTDGVCVDDDDKELCGCDYSDVDEDENDPTCYTCAKDYSCSVTCSSETVTPDNATPYASRNLEVQCIPKNTRNRSVGRLLSLPSSLLSPLL